MKIHGLQKMTLLDFPGRVACTVFLGGCDFRCPYCHNFELADGSAPPVMEEGELLSFLQKRRGLLDGVAITGGEPCLRRDLPDLLRRIRDLGFPVKLDTNGAHPDLLRRLLAEGLVEYVAMDVKNSPDKYALTCGLQALDLGPIRESVRLLLEGTGAFEFRTTVVDQFHTPEDFDRIGQWIRGAERYFLQPFTDRDTVPFAGLSAPGDEKLRACLAAAARYVPGAALRGAE